ncbi:hypothetical protein V8C43DRAFT_186888 [Trichoderma afarasin]
MYFFSNACHGFNSSSKRPHPALTVVSCWAQLSCFSFVLVGDSACVCCCPYPIMLVPEPVPPLHCTVQVHLHPLPLQIPSSVPVMRRAYNTELEVITITPYCVVDFAWRLSAPCTERLAVGEGGAALGNLELQDGGSRREQALELELGEQFRGGLAPGRGRCGAASRWKPFVAAPDSHPNRPGRHSIFDSDSSVSFSWVAGDRQ